MQHENELMDSCKDIIDNDYTENDKVITMNNKIIEIMDCVEHCCYAADVHSLSLSKNTNSINEYFLIVKLKNEI